MPAAPRAATLFDERQLLARACGSRAMCARALSALRRPTREKPYGRTGRSPNSKLHALGYHTGCTATVLQQEEVHMRPVLNFASVVILALACAITGCASTGEKDESGSMAAGGGMMCPTCKT